MSLDNLKSNKKTAIILIISIFLVLVMHAASVIVYYFQYELLLEISIKSEKINKELISANADRMVTVNNLYNFLFLISIVIFISWFYRSYSNIHQLTNNLSYHKMWTIFSWVIPIIQFFKPYQVFKEMFKKTNELLLKNKHNENLSRDISLNIKYVNLWWALWLIFYFINFYAYNLQEIDATIDDWITSTKAHIIAHTIGIPLSVITIKLIKDYSNAEQIIINIKSQSNLPSNGY